MSFGDSEFRHYKPLESQVSVSPMTMVCSAGGFVDLNRARGGSTAAIHVYSSQIFGQRGEGATSYLGVQARTTMLEQPCP